MYAPSNAKTKHISWEFRGKPFQKNGKLYIRAKHRTLNVVWWYSFELDEVIEA
jgi:hypothetical protein